MSKKRIHELDIESVEMLMDVMKFAIGRISETEPKIGYPKSVEELRRLIGDTITEKGIGGETAFKIFKEKMLPTMVPNNNPRHLAYVPGVPTRASVLFDLAVTAVDAHGAYWINSAGGIYGENQAMNWLIELTGLPEGAAGVFTGGGTSANLSALVAARENWRKADEEHQALRGLIMTSRGTHSSVISMAKVIDADVVYVEDDEKDQLNGRMLKDKIRTLSELDKKRLFCVIATAGTTNAGTIDELDSIAEVCEAENLWMHVDAAYGGGALAVPETRPLFKGINRADSITIDPHKWFFAPYDCGALIYKNPEKAKEAHAQHASYLELVYLDKRGFNPTEYQISLSRRLRGLPFWFSLAMHGTKRYVQAIRRGLELARIATEKIKALPYVELVREPSLSVVVFRRKGWEEEDYNRWTLQNQKEGYAVVTPTKWTKKGKTETVTRFCFINPETTEEDITGILKTME